MFAVYNFGLLLSVCICYVYSCVMSLLMFIYPTAAQNKNNRTDKNRINGPSLSSVLWTARKLVNQQFKLPKRSHHYILL